MKFEDVHCCSLISGVSVGRGIAGRLATWTNADLNALSVDGGLSAVLSVDEGIRPLTSSTGANTVIRPGPIQDINVFRCIRLDTTTPV